MASIIWHALEPLPFPDTLGATSSSRDDCATADKRLVWDQDGQTVAPKRAFRSCLVTAAEADSVQTEVKKKKKTGMKCHLRREAGLGSEG